MSNVRAVTVGNLTYTFHPDDPPALADRTQALLRARCVDELSGQPIRGAVQVRCSVPGVIARASADGVIGLLGNPARRFPGLRNNSVELDLTVRASGYVPVTLQDSLGPFNTGNGSPADFPAYFAALDFGTVPLHRQAIQISGRCMEVENGARVPLSNVTVSFSGIWHRMPAADEDAMAVMEAPNVLALSQGLYAPRSEALAEVRGCELIPYVDEDKTLLAGVAAGSTQLRLSDRVNLGVGDVIAIQPDVPERTEYHTIVDISGASTPEQPATLTLALPLRREHRVHARVVRVEVQNLGSANALTRAAITGDQSLFLAALNELDAPAAAISGGAVTEYHQIHRYRAASDSEGYFRLPPLSRVAMVQLHGAHPSPLDDVELLISPDYEQGASRLDLVFS